jgi:hypothetical protein
MIVDSSTVSPAELAEAERVRRMDPQTAGMPAPLVALLLRNAGSTGMLFDMPSPPVPEPKLTDRKDKLKKANNTIAARISKARGVEFGTVNGHLNRLVGVDSKRGLRQCSEQQLETRLRYAQQWLESGEPPQFGA